MASPLLARFMERLWTAADRDYRRKLLASIQQDPQALLLDVGCDDGEWTDSIRRRLGVAAERVHGLEVEPERAALARRRGFDVRIADVDETWPFEASSFTVVHANQVIEHVKRLDHFVQEVKRVLRPRGHAVVCTENLASWHNVFALMLGYQPFSSTNISNLRPIGNPFALHAGVPPEHEALQHVHVVTLTALRDLFSAHGFAVEETWGAGYHPLPPRVGSLDPRHAHFIGIVARRR
jgi:SAM-dependent methyltransferase